MLGEDPNKDLVYLSCGSDLDSELMTVLVLDGKCCVQDRIEKYTDGGSRSASSAPIWCVAFGLCLKFREQFRFGSVKESVGTEMLRDIFFLLLFIHAAADSS